MAKNERAIEVWADWVGLGGPLQVGTLRAAPVRGEEVFSFEYAPAWLAQAAWPLLDPELQLYAGRHYAPEGADNFGVFLDSSPDRWGRMLMQRREARAARLASRAARTLRESDYLLGVHDLYRPGALRFSVTQTPAGPFLDDNDELAAPPLARLRELEQASLNLEREGSEDEAAYDAWLRMLIAPGGSLGGARPKASVVDPQGGLWIAKFPSRHDGRDVGAWEGVVHALAQAAGIDVAPARVERFGASHRTFLVERFDRTPAGERIHFASAMTLLGRRDGDDASTGASYLELAEFIIRAGAQTRDDLEQLWRRIVFNVCVSNTDDHLRNHGFLGEPRGWRLAPAYDMNPVPEGEGLRLNISETDNAQDLALVRSVGAYFRVPPARQAVIEHEVRAAVRRWRAVALEYGLSRGEQDAMAPAFRVAEAG